MAGKRGIAAAVVGLLGAASVARAEEPRPATVSWVRLPGAEGCIGAREVAEAIARRLGPQAIVVPTVAELFVEGRVGPADGGGYVVSFVMADAGGAPLGTREISSEESDCHALDASIALVASLMIDPEAPLREGSASTPPTTPEPGANVPPAQDDARNASSATTEPPADAALAQPPDAAPEPVSALPAPDVSRAAAGSQAGASPGRPWRLGVHASAGLGLGLLPGVPLGAGLRLELTAPGLVPIELGGAFFPERSDQLREGAGADLLAAWGTLGVCPLVPLDGAIRVLGCAAIEGGTIASHGFGFDRSLDDESVIVAGALRVRSFVRLAGPLVIGASASLSVPLLRPRFYALDPAGREREVFRVAPLLGFFELSLGGDFL